MNTSVSVNGVELFFEQRGAGPVLLLVHGFPLDHQMWASQITNLSDSYRVIAPDLRGFGKSGITPGTVTMDQLADDLAALLTQLDVVEPVALCGLSMGGYVAWQFWRRHANRLSHLILCDTRAIADSEDAARQRLETADALLEKGPSLLVEGMIPKLFSDRSREKEAAVIAETEKIILAMSPTGLAAALRGMACREDMTSALPEIDTPALVLCGQDDCISTVTEMKTIADAMPCASFVSIPDCGHLAPMEGPVLVNAEIRGFLTD